MMFVDRFYIFFSLQITHWIGLAPVDPGQIPSITCSTGNHTNKYKHFFGHQLTFTFFTSFRLLLPTSCYWVYTSSSFSIALFGFLCLLWHLRTISFTDDFACITPNRALLSHFKYYLDDDFLGVILKSFASMLLLFHLNFAAQWWRKATMVNVRCKCCNSKIT